MKKTVMQKLWIFNENCMLPTDYYSVGDCFLYSYIKPNNLVSVL